MKEKVIDWIITLMIIFSVVALVIYFFRSDYNERVRAEEENFERFQNHVSDLICSEFQRVKDDFTIEHCKANITQFDDAVSRVEYKDKEEHKRFLVNYYYDVARKYAYMNNSQNLNDVIKVGSSHRFVGPGNFLSVKTQGEIAQKTRNYVYEHYDLFFDKDM